MEKMNDTFDAVVSRLCSVPELTPDQTEARNKILAEECRRERNSQRWEAWRKLTGPMGKRYADCAVHNFAIDETAAHAAAQRTVLEKLQEYADNIVERVSERRARATPVRADRYRQGSPLDWLESRCGCK